MHKITCLDCNVIIRMTEDIFWDFAPNDTIEMEVAGVCPKCGRKYRWTQFYKLDHEQDLEDDE